MVFFIWVWTLTKCVGWCESECGGSAPACSDIPLAGATYQQTKAECLVHVTEAEMPYAMNSHHCRYLLCLDLLFLLVLQGYQWAIDEVAVSWRHPLDKDTASSFVSFLRLLSWSDKPKNRRYENAQNPICMLILKWSIPGIVVAIVVAIIVGKISHSARTAKQWMWSVDICVTLGFQCERSHQDPRLGASLWTHRPSDLEEAALDGTKA